MLSRSSIRAHFVAYSGNFYFNQQQLILIFLLICPKMFESRYKTKFDFETTLRLYNDGVGRKYIPYWAPSLRDSAQYGIYFLPTSRHYKAVMSSQIEFSL